MNKTSLKILAAVTACFGVCSAQANLLNNGSFETAIGCDGPVAPGSVTTLAGWTVVSGNIDNFSRTCFNTVPADGDWAIDLTGTAAGKITQTVATQAGQSYTLGFWFGGNPGISNYSFSDGPIKSMNVLLDGSFLAYFSVDTTGKIDTADPSWSYKTLNFVADSNSTSIAFQSLDTYGAFGPYLDGVSLDVTTPVPEPETYALMLAGLAVVAAAAKRSRNNT